MKKITFLHVVTFLVLLFTTTISYGQTILDGDKCPNDGYDSMATASDPANDVPSSS